MNSSLRLLFLLLTLSSIMGCAVSNDPQRKEMRRLQNGRVKEDTSYVYWLPYAQGTRHRLVQGYFSSYSHKNRVALDFKMKQGTQVFAARGGVVSRLVEDNDHGGLKSSERKFANLVVIDHGDGSRSGYWHLQKNGVVVNVGDTIQQGQLIALSGNTGYTAFPHLHFIAWRSGGSGWRQTGTRFLTKKGAKYLRPLRSYKRVR